MPDEMLDSNQVTERTFSETTSERQCRDHEKYGYHKDDEE